MMGVDGPQLYMNFLKPRIKVGNEFVTQGRNVNQVTIAINREKKKIHDSKRNLQTGRLLHRCHG